jgi:tetratricopeptide (TPR) repeat protein
MKPRLSHSHGELLLCLLLAAVILTVFWQVEHYQFVNYDDDVYVTDNPHVRTGLQGEAVIWAFTTVHAGFWIPLTWLSYMLDYEFYGLNPGGFHLTNVLLHLVNALLLYLLLSRMTGARWRSAFVAGIFALHPLQVESVAWVTERKDVLSTLFWMLTLVAYLRYVERPRTTGYLVLLAAFSLGLMAKPMLVTLPFVLFLLDFWPLHRLGPSASPPVTKSKECGKSILPLTPFSPLFWEKVPLLVLAATASVLAYFTQEMGGAVRSLGGWPLNLRIANALVSYVTYLAKAIWPNRLAVFYPYPEAIPLWQAAGAGFLLVALSILVIRARHRFPYLVVGWLWFLTTLLPVIGLVQVGLQAMADRFTYVPIIGLTIIVGWGVPDLLAQYRSRLVVLAVSATIVLSVLTARSWVQVQHWRNSTVLFEHALQVTQDNFLAHNNLGAELFDQGKVHEAIDHYYQAVQIRPDYDRAYFNLGNAFAELGDIDAARRYYSKAPSFKPAEAHNNLGRAFAIQGRLEDAIANYLEALSLKPDLAEAYNNMGNVLARQGKFAEAIDYFSRALALDPDLAEAHDNLGRALARQKKFAEAIDHFSRALALKPDFAEVHCHLGNTLARLGKLDEAVTHYTNALTLKPNLAEAHNNLGVVLARQGKLRDAAAHFSEALRLRPDYAQARKNLKLATQTLAEANQPSATSEGP